VLYTVDKSENPSGSKKLQECPVIRSEVTQAVGLFPVVLGFLV